jgi:hypothetical protein
MVAALIIDFGHAAIVIQNIVAQIQIQTVILFRKLLQPDVVLPDPPVVICKILRFFKNRGMSTAGGSRRIAAAILPLSPMGMSKATRRTANTTAEKICRFLLSGICHPPFAVTH